VVIVPGEPTGPPATDAAVIEQSWAEPERFEAIFRRYFGRIHQYLAARVGGKIADDLAADVFTIAFAQRQRYDLARDCARPWLYGIATNLVGTYRCQEQRRYRALARAHAQDAAPSDEDLVAERVSAAAAGPALATALARLSSGDRDVLLLVAIAGLDNQEVAQSLGIPHGTVCSRLSRARTPPGPQSRPPGGDCGSRARRAVKAGAVTDGGSSVRGTLRYGDEAGPRG
jgi:RNA polymerase sigma factor (sigma-70 family)